MNGKLEALDADRWTLRFERHLAHPVEKVWRALTEPEQLRSWFPHRIVGDLLTPGAALRFEYPNGEFPAFEGTVLQVEEPTLLEFLWATDTIRFELVPGDGSCTLTLTDTFDELGKAARDGAGWHTCLDFLEATLDAATPSFTSSERWQAVHPGYVKAFGPAASTLGPPEAASGGYEGWSRFPTNMVGFWDHPLRGDVLRPGQGPTCSPGSDVSRYPLLPATHLGGTSEHLGWAGEAMPRGARDLHDHENLVGLGDIGDGAGVDGLPRMARRRALLRYLRRGPALRAGDHVAALGPSHAAIETPPEVYVRILRVTSATANTSVPEEPSPGRGSGHLDGRIVRWLERRREVGGGNAPGLERNIEEAHGLTTHGQRLGR
jgi:uncharacterized protein YndB with AHSA1/START domain